MGGKYMLSAVKCSWRPLWGQVSDFCIWTGKKRGGDG